MTDDLNEYDRERISLDESEPHDVGEGEREPTAEDDRAAVRAMAVTGDGPADSRQLAPNDSDRTPSLTCCRPTAYAAGRSVTVHSPVCPVSPDQPLTRDELERWRKGILDRPRTLADAVRDHPAGKDTRSNVSIWMTHPYGHDCEACQYVEAWLDGHDDIRKPIGEGA